MTSALYSIALSALLCLIFVGIFTGCPLLTSVTLATVGCIACFVLACFYLLGWHLGAVEAISMSILIGTAVDYCVHLVQGYIVASRHLKAAPISKSQPVSCFCLHQCYMYLFCIYCSIIVSFVVNINSIPVLLIWTAVTMVVVIHLLQVLMMFSLSFHFLVDIPSPCSYCTVLSAGAVVSFTCRPLHCQLGVDNAVCFSPTVLR